MDLSWIYSDAFDYLTFPGRRAWLRVIWRAFLWLPLRRTATERRLGVVTSALRRAGHRMWWLAHLLPRLLEWRRRRSDVSRHRTNHGRDESDWWRLPGDQCCRHHVVRHATLPLFFQRRLLRTSTGNIRLMSTTFEQRADVLHVSCFVNYSSGKLHDTLVKVFL